MMKESLKTYKHVTKEGSFIGVKSYALKKISGMLALLLFISILTPVLAFASIAFKSGSTYSNNDVTGTVYTDAYADGVTNAVYVDVYDNNGNFVTTTKATYSSVVGGVYYYNFDANTVSRSTYLNLKTRWTSGSGVPESVYSTVYDTTPSAYVGGFGGFGGIVSPTEDSSTLSVDANGNIDTDALRNALSNRTQVTITITGDSVSLPATALQGAKDGAVVVVKSNIGTYSLPLSVLKLDDLAKALGVDVADLSIKVTVQKVSGDTATALNSAASSAGVKLLTDAVDFNVVAVSKDVNSVKVDFGNTYVSRTLNVTGDLDASNTTGVLYDPVAQTFSFVPSTFDKENGNTVATLKRNGNSIYTVASFNKSFTDINNHWAKADIQLLANKMVINGMTDTTFAPDSNITRGEFAALVVRALGLQVDTNAASAFSDVTASDWYNGVVAAAAKAGLINGYEDGTFKANKQITREELSALVVRALKYAGVQTDVSADQQASLLVKYSDANNIVWAKAEIAEAINAGIINGVTDTTIAPDKQATRAESATMLKRFLSKAGFIN